MFSFSFLLVSSDFCLCQQNKSLCCWVSFFFPRKCKGFFFLFFFARFQLFDFGREIIVEKVFLEMMTEAKLYSFVENRDI